MELTEKQLAYILDRLEKDGIKYWDLRLELLDHVAVLVEDKLVAGTNFRAAVQESFEEIGWKENFNGSCFESLIATHYKEVYKGYQRQHRKAFVSFFKSVPNTVVFMSGIGLYLILAYTLSFRYFNKMSVIIFILPVVYYFYLLVKSYVKKWGPSMHLESGLAVYGLAFTIMQGVVNLATELSETVQLSLWIGLMPVYLLSSFTGYLVFKNSLRQLNSYKKVTSA